MQNGKVDDALRTLEHGVTMIDDPAARLRSFLLVTCIIVEHVGTIACIEPYKNIQTLLLLTCERPVRLMTAR